MLSVCYLLFVLLSLLVFFTMILFLLLLFYILDLHPQLFNNAKRKRLWFGNIRSPILSTNWDYLCSLWGMVYALKYNNKFDFLGGFRHTSSSNDMYISIKWVIDNELVHFLINLNYWRKSKNIYITIKGVLCCIISIMKT